MSKVPVFFIKDRAGVENPRYAHDTDAGADVLAMESVQLTPLKPVIVSTGIRCCLPKGYEIQVRSRSGLASKGVFVLNAPGTIDENYTGEIKVILVSLVDNYNVAQYDKIAQLVLSPVVQADFMEVSDISWHELVAAKDRGDKGFGSTGK